MLPVHDPVLIFAIVMLIVLLVPIAFTKVRVPGLVGLILAGAVVGPSGIGLLERDATIVLLGTVGLLYLMFVAGLALDLAQFNRQKGRSITFGLLSFFLPQSLGILTGLHLLGFSLASSLLLGSIVGSHTLLAYPVASRLGITRNKGVIMTMGGTIVTDLLALLLLAVVVAASQGTLGAAFWVRFIGLITLYLFAVLKGLPRIGRWFLRTTHGEPNIAFIFLTTALFVTAYLAQLAGLAPIIGAFLAGIVLNRLVPEMGPLMSRVRFVGETLFVPFFLLSVGMLVDFRVLFSSLSVWTTALLFTGLVVVGKGVAAALSALVYRHTLPEAWTIFGLSVPQAAATLAVTLIGFNLGLFEEEAVNAVVVMILITCMLGPWIVERQGRRIAIQEEASPTDAADRPQRILIPLSNPQTADALVDVALAIRDANSAEPVFPLTVVRDGDDVTDQVAAGEKLLSSAVVHAVASDVPVTPITRVDVDVTRGMARAVAESRISHLVIGWGGNPSPGQRIFGSILDRLLDVTSIPVLVCRLRQPINTFGRTLLIIPPHVEREPGFPEALSLSKTMAARLGMDMEVVFASRHRTRIETAMNAVAPTVPFTLTPLSAFGRLQSVLSDRLDESTVVVLLTARETQRSWQPALDRLPRTFAGRFPAADFIVLYPPNEEARLPLRHRETSSPDDVTAVEVVREIDAVTLPSAVDEMIRRSFSDPEPLLQSAGASLLAERDYMLQELAPGVVLLHGHVSAVDRQLILIGECPGTLAFEGMTAPARLLLILLNPVDFPPERHLRSLAHVARAVHHLLEKSKPGETPDPELLRATLLP